MKLYHYTIFLTTRLYRKYRKKMYSICHNYGIRLSHIFVILNITRDIPSITGALLGISIYNLEYRQEYEIRR